MTKKIIYIKGMHCASCASNIEKSLKKVPGVKEVSVSLMTNKAFVTEEGAKNEELSKAVERAGYKIISIE
ncbi:heavy-metal-associated domain-containing protein [Candidatus Pacearchaeota archaeon]|nr:heavy-metal-associated domain-containing protein [Candidatus Pacearchaeota archaeon]